MNSDGITRISLLRNVYKAQGNGSSSEVVRELQEIKNELKISNDEKVREEEPISNIYKSPYLPDQIFFRKDAVYNSSEETKWKEVKSSDQVQKEVQDNYSDANKRKLNIL